MLQDEVHVQHNVSECCKTRFTCNIASPNVARRGSRATKCTRMLQDAVHLQHNVSECCKTRVTCNISTNLALYSLFSVISYSELLIISFYYYFFSVYLISF